MKNQNNQHNNQMDRILLHYNKLEQDHMMFLEEHYIMEDNHKHVWIYQLHKK